MGRVSPPVNVRSVSDIPKALDRMKKGNVTIVFVYADWCGHCHNFKPKFENATRTPKRNTEAVSVNEKVLDSFNNALVKSIPTATPIEPDGYPEVVIINNKGQNIGNVPSSASEEDLISVVTNGNTMAATPVANKGSANVNSVTNNLYNNMGSNAGSNAERNITDVEPMPTPIMNSKAMNSNANKSTVPISNARTPSKSNNSYDMDILPSASVTGPVLPPTGNDDLMGTADTSEPAPTQTGGSLFGSLSSAAYTLAPAGVLLASLHAMRSRRSRGGARRSRKTQKKNHRSSRRK